MDGMKNVLNVLFSPNRGLISWTPLVAPVIGGLFYLLYKERRFGLMLLFNFVLQTYIIASWWVWDGMIGPGNRLFTNMFPAFALGLAALLDKIGQRVNIVILGMACSLFVFWKV